MSTIYLYPLIFLPSVVAEPGDYITRSGEKVNVQLVSTRLGFHCVGTYYDSAKNECWHHSGRLFPTLETKNDIVRAAWKN